MVSWGSLGELIGLNGGGGEGREIGGLQNCDLFIILKLAWTRLTKQLKQNVHNKWLSVSIDHACACYAARRQTHEPWLTVYKVRFFITNEGKKKKTPNDRSV